jgi:hypothetical protein
MSFRMVAAERPVRNTAAGEILISPSLMALIDLFSPLIGVIWPTETYAMTLRGDMK